MAFIDLGDQFIALDAGGRSRRTAGATSASSSTTRSDGGGAREAGAQMVGGHDFLDPWGNHWQVVDYREVQFTKAPRVLEGMGSRLEKSDEALAELREKGLAN